MNKKSEDQLQHKVRSMRRRIEELEALLTECRWAEAELLKRDAVLDAVRFATEKLLAVDSIEEAFDDILGRLGEAADVSRVYIFENHTDDDGTLVATQRYEWTAPGVEPQTENPDLQGFPYHAGGFGRWVEAMERGEMIHGHIGDFPDAEREVLGPQSIRSIVAVPIFVNNRWWGFIGFDECSRERDWSRAVMDALKAAAGAIGSAMQRRFYETELRETTELLAEAQRLSGIGSWEWVVARNEARWSENLYRIFRVEPERFRTNAYETFLDCVHPGDRDAVKEVMEKALADTAPFELTYRIVRPDETVRTIQARGKVVCDDAGAPVRILGTSQDVTERKLAEEKLAESEHKFRAIFTSASDGLVLADSYTRRLTMANKTFCRMLGYTEDEVLCLKVEDIHPEESLPSVVRDFAKAASTGACFGKDVPVRRKDGSILYVDISGSKIGTDGKSVMLGAFRDVTERKRTEDEINRYKNNLEAIFRSVKDAIITVDPDLRVMESNESAERLCGISRLDIGKSYAECASCCSLRCLDVIQKTLLTGEPQESSRIECENAAVHPRTITINTYPLIDSSGEFAGAVLVVKDETRLADLEKDLEERRQLHNIVGSSEKMNEIYHLIENLADIDTTVLITGESGTGKELVAEALHYTGTRSANPMVKVNCSALPERLLESELFGHVKGAFTGAVRDRAGRFELADGGTIFLDEIGDISPEMQLRLLRVIQEKEFERLGDSRTTGVDVRVIAATNRDLTDKVRKGEFREDLYYRLKVVELAMPPLQERLEDLPLLEDFFIKKFNKKFNRDVKGLSTDVQKIFMTYPWPGNIRELEHVIERAFIISRDSIISTGDLPPSLLDHSRNRAKSGASDGVSERDRILQALYEASWNKSKAARRLGISRITLYRKIERYGLRNDVD